MLRLAELKAVLERALQHQPQEHARFAEREQIAILRATGLSLGQIARRLGRVASTISRGLRRHALPKGGYRSWSRWRPGDRRGGPGRRGALERRFYERGEAPGRGHRNGHRTRRLKTADGGLEYPAPQVAGLEQPFRSARRDHLTGHTEALESLAVEMLARGLPCATSITPSRTRPGGCRCRRRRSRAA